MNYQAIMHCSCCQRELRHCRWEPHDSSVVKQRGKTLSGRRPQSCCACVCAFLGGLSITQSKEADRFDMSESVSGWGHYARSRTAGPSHQHKHTCSRAWAHKQAHTRTGFYGNSKQTVGACGDPTPTERKREKPRLRSKNRSKSKIESEMKHPVTYALLSRSQIPSVIHRSICTEYIHKSS